MKKRLQKCKISLRNTSRQTQQERGLNILPLWSIFCSLFLSCGVVWTTMPPTVEFSTVPTTCTRRLYRAHPQTTAGIGDFYPSSTRLKWKCEENETFTSPTKWKMPYCELQNSNCFLYVLGGLVYRKCVSCLQRRLLIYFYTPAFQVLFSMKQTSS